MHVSVVRSPLPLEDALLGCLLGRGALRCRLGPAAHTASGPRLVLPRGCRERSPSCVCCASPGSGEEVLPRLSHSGRRLCLAAIVMAELETETFSKVWGSSEDQRADVGQRAALPQRPTWAEEGRAPQLRGPGGALSPYGWS